jgi:hypothetical protein
VRRFLLVGQESPRNKARDSPGKEWRGGEGKVNGSGLRRDRRGKRKGSIRNKASRYIIINTTPTFSTLIKKTSNLSDTQQNKPDKQKRVIFTYSG